MRERDAPGVFLVVRVSRQNRSARLIDFSDHVEVVAITRRPECPLVIDEDAEPAIRGSVIGQREQGEPDGIVGIDENGELVPDTPGCS